MSLNSLWKKGYKFFADFVSIKNISPGFESDYTLQKQVLNLIIGYIKFLNFENLKYEVIELDGLTPFLHIELKMSDDPKIGFYAHADKQPPLTDKWHDGLDPYTLTIKGNKAYGRGTVDDGYAIFLTLNMLKKMEFEEKKGNYVFLIETSEESGSCHLSHYLTYLKDKLDDIKYLFVIDSGGPDNERLWFTTSFRGCFMSTLEVRVAEKAQHSGEVGGILPDPFQIASSLTSRLQDPTTGETKLGFELTKFDKSSAYDLISHFGKEFIKVDKVDSLKITTSFVDAVEAYISNTLTSSMTVIGIEGLPDIANGGNMIHPYTKLKLSIRTNPKKKVDEVIEEVKSIVTKDVPFDAEIKFEPGLKCNGWYGDYSDEKLQEIINNVSNKYYNNDVGFVGSGGSIPIMGMFAEMLPKCTIFATGVLTPDSGAHGPNEFLDLNALEKFSNALYEMVQSL